MLVSIRPISINDFPYVLEWSKDDTFSLANGWELNRNEDSLYKWWFHCVKNQSDDFVRLGIEYKRRLIGYVDLANIKENRAEIGIAIGESALWGNGLGYDAVLSMVQYASKEMGINIFDAETHKENIRSRKMLEKLGFREISRIGYEIYLGKNTQLIQYQMITKGSSKNEEKYDDVDYTHN